jgi:hypothetical protein
MRRVAFALSVVLAVVALAACGRKATRADCETIVDRNVEVQLKSQGTVDPATIAKRRDEIRAEMKDRIDQCVGKRLTDGMMACVKKAETADQIDKCLR